jgi:ribosomal protein S18 acetylase RimI-like enzyme
MIRRVHHSRERAAVHADLPIARDSAYSCGSMITIRKAMQSDESALGRYGAALMRQHHAADPRRFIIVEHPESGYGRFLVSMLDDPECLVLAAESAGEVVGYVFAGLEPLSWKDLRGPCGFVHDVYVDERARGQGAGHALVQAAIEWIHSQGRSQVVLGSAWNNSTAQRLFEHLGFRRTMVEMTRDGESGA